MIPDCAHPERVLLLLDCGAGGRQYRRYCLTCWQDIEGAIPHARAIAKLRGDDPIVGDLDQLHKARDAYLARIWGARRGVAR